MHLEFLVEEPSAKAALDNLVPRIVPAQDTFFAHPHEGKADLLDKLPGRLQGYRSWMPADWTIIVLIDRDQPVANCERLKQELEAKATAAGLWTRATAPPGQSVHVINRLAVEELEAWFFGDVPALVAAYPGVSPYLGKQAKYRDPDAIAGGTWEALQRVLQRAGYYPDGLPKIEVAVKVSEHMDPDRNRSRSFQVFRDTLRNLTAQAPAMEEE